MPLKLYNSASRAKEAFVPLDPSHVRMYVCGPTVYDRAHIGNARPVVVFDVLYRLLKATYERVTYCRNITDVDDKIIAAARDRNIPIDRLTSDTTQAYHEDMAALGALDPDVEPRATEHVPQMIAMIECLIERGNAYVADGHVLFSVPSMPEYGRLANRDMREMIAGARVEVAPYKQDPADFVLWKPSEADQPGWDSPWGRGRPGWHIECSAMSEAHLGESFDIHGGGLDLIFPHHENEIAQSTCAHGGKLFARYWVHNGYLTVNGEKMSKSLGNFFTVRDLLDQAPGEAIRFYMMGTHYRQPLDWTLDGLCSARAGLDRFYSALRDVAEIETGPDEGIPQTVRDALEDDLNTPQAIAALHEIATSLNKAADAADKKRLKAELLTGGGVLGLLCHDPEAWFKGEVGVCPDGGPSAAEIEAEIERRTQARKEKDFAEADRIRDALADQGIVLEDKPDGTIWRRAG
ncbi:MAG: cysteine--tRNA ligase [Alphaproteobacteria bacterium]|nr:cysteine--tRNA ligase [Alphaproteobacteria bacterium]